MLAGHLPFPAPLVQGHSPLTCGHCVGAKQKRVFYFGFCFKRTYSFSCFCGFS